jgi:hypothetical protein
MITGVAVKTKDGTIYSSQKPNRHHHIIHQITERNPEIMIGSVQGFVTDKGEFVDRKVGAQHVIECGQIDKLNWPPNLYSEDLW